MSKGALNLLLDALECEDIGELAGMYGEARDSFENIELMQAIGKRMAVVQAASPAAKEKDAPSA